MHQGCYEANQTLRIYLSFQIDGVGPETGLSPTALMGYRLTANPGGELIDGKSLKWNRLSSLHIRSRSRSRSSSSSRNSNSNSCNGSGSGDGSGRGRGRGTGTSSTLSIGLYGKPNK